jgi:hypothetical protein
MVDSRRLVFIESPPGEGTLITAELPLSSDLGVDT